MDLPSRLRYPVIVVGDLHGQRAELESLVERIDAYPDGRGAAFAFLGDFVDRGPDVRGALDLVLELLARPPGGSAVRGNHDHALVRAAGLDGLAPSPYWTGQYLRKYDADATFRAYLEDGMRGQNEHDLVRLCDAMPEPHRRFLAALPWVVEMEGHLLLHAGLSPELEADAEEQVAALHDRDWNRERLRPVAGSETDRRWKDAYPVWLGASRALSADPLPHPTKVQVTGHVRVPMPDPNAIRIRIDTSGGDGALTACLLRGPDERPVFLSSRGEMGRP